MREKPLGFLHSAFSRRLRKTWPVLARNGGAYLKIPKYFLLYGCMYLSYNVLKVVFDVVEHGFGAGFSKCKVRVHKMKQKRSRHIFSAYTSLLAQLAFVPFPFASSIQYVTERSKKGRPREKGSIRWLQSGSTEARSVGALCIWQVE